MSKWSLLKSAISGKADTKSDAKNVSIHRFEGFEVIRKQKVLWKGFQLQINLNQEGESSSNKNPVACGQIYDISLCDQSVINNFNEFIRSSYQFISAVDCQECSLVVYCEGRSSLIKQIEAVIKEGEAQNNYRLQYLTKELVGKEESSEDLEKATSEVTTSVLKAAFYIKATSSESNTKSCQYMAYDIHMKSFSLATEDDCSCHANSLFSSFFEEDNEGDVSRGQVVRNEGDPAGKMKNKESSNQQKNEYEINVEIEDKTETRTGMKILERIEVEPERTFRTYTREQSPSSRVSGSGLFSHLLHGVDNTGNIKVWSSELLLLHTIMSDYLLRGLFRGKRVLELGGGLTGLCGLGLAYSDLAACVVLTDGHPDCVQNQEVCVQMNEQINEHSRRLQVEEQSGKCVSTDLNEVYVRSSCSVRTSLLRWSVDDTHEDLEKILKTNMNSRSSKKLDAESDTKFDAKFDIVIAADCLFFKDFHDEFIWVIKNSLKDRGFCFLLQPKRGNSLDLFLEKIKLISCFEIVFVTDHYCEKVSSMRKKYLEDEDLKSNNTYVEDIHYPLLICLQLK